jgi:hypothetical protein
VPEETRLGTEDKLGRLEGSDWYLSLGQNGLIRLATPTVIDRHLYGAADADGGDARKV